MIAIARAWREGRLAPARLGRDALAGVVVGVVAIPLTMAFSIASGCKPEQGLVTGILAGTIVAILGGTQVQVAGPTGAFVVVLLGIVRDHGVGGLLAATVLAGVILVALGVARLGAVIRFIPHPVTTGFTAGIGTIIFVGQVPEFLGLSLGPPAREFTGRVAEIARALPTARWETAAIGVATLLALLGWPRVTRRVPAPLVAMLLGTALLLAWGPTGVETIGSRFGGIPAGLPPFALPDVDLARLPALVAPAFAIAMLGAIESLLSAVVADGMTGDVHDSNQELIGQGIANLVVPFFGGIAATGAIARTATNVRSGGRSPVAAITHSVVLLVVVLLLAPQAAHVPLAALAAILFVVAWNMSEVHAVVRLLRGGSRSDRVVLLATYLLTVFVDLVVAVEVGVVLAALLFVKHMSERVTVGEVAPVGEGGDPYQDLAVAPPPEIAIYEVDGPFFFGVAQRFESTVAAVSDRVEVVVLRLWRVPYLDASGGQALSRAIAALSRRGRAVVLSGVRPAVAEVLDRTGLAASIGAERIFPDLERALAFARAHVVRKAAGSGPPA